MRQPACHLNEDWAYSRFLVQADAVIARRQRFCLQGGVIDVGCGTGIVLAHVASRFAWGIGVDISRNMIRVARKKSIPNARFLKTDMFKLSRICPSAAAIVSRGVLLSHYGCQQGAALLRELRRALVPGGFVLLDFLNRSARDPHHHVSETKTYFRGEEICRMARQAGFKTIKILGRMERRVLLLIAEINGCSAH